MAQVIDAGKNLIKDNSGKTITAQQGAWYDGQQYWGGTLSKAGDINSLSDQKGAGQTVSKETVDQTNLANWDYLHPKTPSTPAELSSSLDKFQNSTFDSVKTSPTIKVATMDELKATLQPSTPAPTPLNRTEEFSKLLEQYKVSDLETSLSDLKAQEDEAIAALRQTTATERGKPVAQGVIEGRISQETRTAQENLDFIGRQKSRVIDELNTKYNLVNTFMNFKGLDYQDAVKRYDDEFAKNIQIYGIIQNQQDKAIAQQNVETNNARANLQIYVNAITAGNIDVNSLSGDQKLMLNKLEVQSGLPVGFISSIKKDPKADIIFTNTNNGVTQVGMRNQDGTISVQSYGTATGGTGTQAEQMKKSISDMAKRLQDSTDKSGKVSSSNWSQMRALWLRAGNSGDDFDKTFGSQYNPDYSPY